MIPKCKQVEKKLEYLAEEQVVGKWIDGKPIYRKTFKFQLNGTYTENNKKYTWCTTNIQIDAIVKVSGYISLTNGSKYFIGNNVSDFSVSIDASSNIFIGLRSDLQSGQWCYIVLEYTKQ